MPEPDKPRAEIPPPPAESTRGPARAAARTGHPLGWLFFILLLAAAGYGLWRGWIWAHGTLEAVSSQEQLLARVGRDVQGLRAQADELASRQTELAQAVQRNGGELASLGGRVEDGEQALARLNDTVEGGRTRVQLAAVEQLMLMANDRLLLAHDALSALKALDLADQRLARLSDPRLYPVREALSQERLALSKATLPDKTGLALSLGEIQKRAATLPLRVHVPAHFEAQPEPPPAPVAGSWGSRAWAATKTALSKVFELRRDPGPQSQLLPPEQAALVGQILQLKLEGARLALLAGDAVTFQDLTAASRDWVAQNYDGTDTDVQLALKELDRLHGAALVPAVPDISRSLTLLRGVLGATGQ